MFRQVPATRKLRVSSWSDGSATVTGRRLHWGLVLGLSLAVASGFPCFGQDEEKKTATITAAGTDVKVKPNALLESFVDGTLWTGLGPEFVEQCKEARELTFVEPTAKPAKERYVAAKKFRDCLSLLEPQDAMTSKDDKTLLKLQVLLRAQDDEAKARELAADKQTEFLGITFGVGIGASYSQDDVVSEAELGPGNTVIATKSSKALPRVILESHYYGWCKSKQCNAGEFGIGPFFGIVAKSDELISAVGAGVMFGWKDKKPENSQGFSIGIGVVLDDEVKSLAHGFEAGQPLPPGETEIRFEEKGRWSGLLIFTRTF